MSRSSRQGGKGLERELVLGQKPTYRGGVQPPPELGPGPARHHDHHWLGRQAHEPLGDREPVEAGKQHVKQDYIWAQQSGLGQRPAPSDASPTTEYPPAVRSSRASFRNPG